MSTRKNITSGAPRRAVGYVRISVDRDNETSTTTQAERIRAYCDAQGLEVADIVTEAGRSAYKASRASRPGLRKAARLVATGAADVLVCWKIDRVARNTRDLLNIIEELESAGAAFASVTEQFDTSSPIGKMVVTVIGALAEMESAVKSERTLAWQDYRRSAGAVPTGPRPFGYVRTRNQLTIDETEAAVIREAAAAMLGGATLRSLVKRLNDSGAANGRGRPLSGRGLTTILTSPTTAGLRTIEDTFLPGGWEPILDRHTWEEVRTLFADPARRLGPGPARRHLLPGMLECGRDGTPLTSKSHVRGTRYACRKCTMSISGSDTDAVVERVVLGLLDARAWKRLRSRGSRQVDTGALEAELAGLAQQRADDEITAAEWKILRTGLVAQLEDAAATPIALPDIADPRKEWPSLPIAARRLIIVAVTPRIVIAPARSGNPRFDATRITIDTAEQLV